MKAKIHNYFILGIVSLLLSSSVNASSNLTSRPVGFVRISIATNEQRLVSLPFRPFDASINKVLASQLTGSADEQTAGQVMKWDAAVMKYIRALKAGGTGNTEIDGKWFSDFEKLVPSDMPLQPGEGFFLCNKQSMSQDVYVAGAVVLDATNSIILMPSLNLIGYPYSTAVSNSSALPVAGSSFEMGRGYWYNNTSDVSIVWVETRPYVDVFPPAGEKPSITGIEIISGKKAKLTIETEGAAGEKLDIYYKDLAPMDRLETEKGWLIADMDIPVNGMTSIEWIDTGNSQRKPANEVFARIYLVGRTDIDVDHDNVPDVRQKFVFGRNIAAAMSSELNATLTTTSVINGTSANSLTVNSLPVIGRIIYVDRNTGADHLTGRSAVVVGSDGPKKTINAGLSIAETGNTVIILPGIYREKVKVPGGVKVIAVGRVEID